MFVYNVDGTPVAFLRDAYLGLTTGSTDCHLCDLTFGRVLKDKTWSAFVDGLPYRVDFQLRSTFAKHHPTVTSTYPAAFLRDGDGQVHEVLGSDEIDAAADLDDLRALVSDLVDRLQTGS